MLLPHHVGHVASPKSCRPTERYVGDGRVTGRSKWTGGTKELTNILPSSHRFQPGSPTPRRAHKRRCKCEKFACNPSTWQFAQAPVRHTSPASACPVRHLRATEQALIAAQTNLEDRAQRRRALARLGRGAKSPAAPGRKRRRVHAKLAGGVLTLLRSRLCATTTRTVSA